VGVKGRQADLLIDVLGLTGIGLPYRFGGSPDLAVLALAFFLPIYVIRLAVWSFWPCLRTWASERLTPTGWVAGAIAVWAALAAAVACAAPMVLLGSVILPWWAGWIGLVAACSGLLLAMWAEWLLGFRTAILATRVFDRHGADATRVIDTGPYALVPHPMFVGEGMMILGCFLLSGELAVLALFLVSVLVNLYAARGEEKDLRARFGDDYASYRCRLGLRRLFALVGKSGRRPGG